MDAIKTHCYASFAGEEAAKRAIDGLQGLRWPELSSKRLEAKMADVSPQEVRFGLVWHWVDPLMRVVLDPRAWVG